MNLIKSQTFRSIVAFSRLLNKNSKKIEVNKEKKGMKGEKKFFHFQNFS